MEENIPLRSDSVFSCFPLKSIACQANKFGRGLYEKKFLDTFFVVVRSCLRLMFFPSFLSGVYSNTSLFLEFTNLSTNLILGSVGFILNTRPGPSPLICRLMSSPLLFSVKMIFRSFFWRFRHPKYHIVNQQMAALDQYIEEAVSQTNSFREDDTYSEKWESGGDSDRNESNGFDCNICLDCVQDPVVTLCGHLYCWPCIYKWLHFHNLSNEENGEQSHPQCPVCKTEVSQSSLVPLYGRGQTPKPSSKCKSHHVSTMIPQRPHGPLSMVDPRRPFNATPSAVPQPSSQFYHHGHYPYYPPPPQEFNSIPSSSNSGMLGMGIYGALRNAFDSRIGVFGEMIYARVFGNQVTNIYSYPNTYNLAGNSNPRIRRHLMQADKQLNRICVFLLCSLVLCLLLF